MALYSASLCLSLGELNSVHSRLLLVSVMFVLQFCFSHKYSCCLVWISLELSLDFFLLSHTFVMLTVSFVEAGRGRTDSFSLFVLEKLSVSGQART